MANELNHYSVVFEITKIIPVAMQTLRILQAVALMMVVAMAASCAAGKEYAGKIFPNRDAMIKDSPVLVLRFLETDSINEQDGNWVTTDIIMGRDTSFKTTALDNFSRVFPPTAATRSVTDSVTSKELKSVTAKPVTRAEEAVAKNHFPGEVRTRKSRDD
jgi:hypothetical protein